MSLCVFRLIDVQTSGANEITMKGTLEPHTSSSDLAIVSELFTTLAQLDAFVTVALVVPSFVPRRGDLALGYARFLRHPLPELNGDSALERLVRLFRDTRD